MILECTSRFLRWISLEFVIWYLFSFRVFWSFWSVVAFYHERAAFFHEKRLILTILSDLVISSNLWLFIMNGRLFFMKKRLFLAILSDLVIFSNLWLFIMNGRFYHEKKAVFGHFIRFGHF